MRPPVAAGPMARASSPPKVYESSSAAAAFTAGPADVAGAAGIDAPGVDAAGIDAAGADAAGLTGSAWAGAARPPRPAASTIVAPATAPRAIADPRPRPRCKERIAPPRRFLG